MEFTERFNLSLLFLYLNYIWIIVSKISQFYALTFHILNHKNSYEIFRMP